MGQGGGGFLSGIKKLFTKEGWSGKNSAVQNLFDPGRLFIGAEESTPNPKVPEEVDADAAEAQERERQRLSSSGRRTVLSGGRRAALSSNIGKRTLGGTS